MIVLALCVGLLALAPAAVAIDNGVIVFQGNRRSDDGSQTQAIYTMPPSGGPAKRLVAGTQPSISRNGRKIAYVRGIDDAARVWTIDADGGNPHEIADGKLVESEPALSPDGKQVVFVGDPKGLQGTHLFIADVDGSHVRQLTNGSAESEPAFSPDGKRIAFIRPREQELMTMSVNGGDVTMVAGPDGPAPVGDPRSPSYTANGRSLVFSGGRGHGQQIFSVVDDGKSLLPLTKDDVTSLEPSAAPNGSGIAFYRDGNLFTISMLGTEQKQLTSIDKSDGTNSHPSWGG
jgi:Tol biopolymer transport system component